MYVLFDLAAQPPELHKSVQQGCLRIDIATVYVREINGEHLNASSEVTS